MKFELGQDTFSQCAMQDLCHTPEAVWRPRCGARGSGARGVPPAVWRPRCAGVAVWRTRPPHRHTVHCTRRRKTSGSAPPTEKRFALLCGALTNYNFAVPFSASRSSSPRVHRRRPAMRSPPLWAASLPILLFLFCAVGPPCACHLLKGYPSFSSSPCVPRACVFGLFA